MISLSRCTPVGGDETAGYKVTMDIEYTVIDFINEVVKKNTGEWGRISIRGTNIELKYRRGEIITDIDKNNYSKIIVSALASGGWSNMDYYLTVK